MPLPVEVALSRLLPDPGPVDARFRLCVVDRDASDQSVSRPLKAICDTCSGLPAGDAAGAVGPPEVIRWCAEARLLGAGADRSLRAASRRGQGRLTGRATGAFCGFSSGGVGSNPSRNAGRVWWQCRSRRSARRHAVAGPERPHSVSRSFPQWFNGRSTTVPDTRCSGAETP